MKRDKSPQGFYDPDIIPLLKIINKNYETTSSCSGRITLMKGARKGETSWIYKSHTIPDADAIYNRIQEHGVLRFLYEPLIIHVKCRTKEKAEKLLITLQSNGFKKSCLISFPDYLIEINDTGKMETIVTKDLSKGYISLLVKEANTRLKKTKENMKKLESIFA